MPRDSATPWRLELRKVLLARAVDAADCGGLDMHLPTERSHDVTLPASFVVSQIDASSGAAAGPPTGVPSSDVAAMLIATTEGAEVAALGGAAATRTERVVAADPARRGEPQVASRRVDYAAAVPGAPGQWLLVSFSTTGAKDPDDGLTLLMVELFDAVMSTFRWMVPRGDRPAVSEIGDSTVGD